MGSAPVGIGIGFGVPLGLYAAANRHGLIDEIVMRGNDLIFAFPSLLLAILITAVFGPGAVNAIIATEENIVIPNDSSGAVQPEGQLGVVIGKKARRVSRSEALGYVFGYTIGNDISQRDWQGSDRTMFPS